MTCVSLRLALRPAPHPAQPDSNLIDLPWLFKPNKSCKQHIHMTLTVPSSCGRAPPESPSPPLPPPASAWPTPRASCEQPPSSSPASHAPRTGRPSHRVKDGAVLLLLKYAAAAQVPLHIRAEWLTGVAARLVLGRKALTGAHRSAEARSRMRDGAMVKPVATGILEGPAERKHSTEDPGWLASASIHSRISGIIGSLPWIRQVRRLLARRESA